MLKFGIAALGFGLLSVSSVYAQSTFDGRYWGLTLGYGNGDMTHINRTGGVDNINGAAVGGFVGWNGSKGRVVYGVEGDLSLGRLNETQPCNNPVWTCKAEISALATLRGRVGIESGQSLLYLTGGVAAARMEFSTSTGGTVFPDTNTATGWVAGLGIEGHWRSSPWNYRVEYMHMDFGKETYQADIDYISDFDSDIVRIGLSKRF
jgi:opacity protein-like surface antigen